MVESGYKDVFLLQDILQQQSKTLQSKHNHNMFLLSRAME
jgi:hypothetical protein